MSSLGGSAPSVLAAQASRAAVDAARREVRGGRPAPDFDSIVEAARANLRSLSRSLLRPVINATGVIVHTNLGRVPLGERQAAAIHDIATGYSNLEFDLQAGRRGSRHSGVGSLLTALTGAEAALVTNNNAAAVLTTLAALCSGREVVISRGELIEIGGHFRIPDVMAASGARLVEIGTTNRTHLHDYEAAITPETAAILKVHRSNYRVVGFTSEVPQRSLAELAKGHVIPFLYDIGSGLLEHGPEWADSEPSVTAALEDGADLVMFSGDKLLGGPQAGVIAGNAGLVARVAEHPLMRAVRPDKLTLAALQATVLSYLEGDEASLPLWRMIGHSSEDLHLRAESLAGQISGRLGDEGTKAEAVVSGSVTGGGSLPGTEMASWAVAVSHGSLSPEGLGGALRAGDPPVIARIEDDRILLDLRCVPPEADDRLASALLAVLG